MYIIYVYYNSIIMFRGMSRIEFQRGTKNFRSLKINKNTPFRLKM